MDYSEFTLLLELAFVVINIPFVYLCWASGYLGILTRQARKNRWGLSLLRHQMTSTEEWEAEFGTNSRTIIPPGPVYRPPTKLTSTEIPADSSWYARR